MTNEQIEKLANELGMIFTNTHNKFWTASTKQLKDFAEAIIADVKQSASEMMIQAIKKAAEYERSECAKLADYAGSKEAAKAIRERKND